MADIRRFPFTLHLRSNPTNYVIHTRKGALAHRGGRRGVLLPASERGD